MAIPYFYALDGFYRIWMEIDSSVIVSPELHIDEIDVASVATQNYVILSFVFTFGINIYIPFGDIGI